jgi:hypothetical protein
LSDQFVRIVIFEVIMVDVVNLRQHRKRKARDEKSRKAEVNRAAYGRTRSERDETRAQQDMAAKKIDGHLRQTDDAPQDGAPNLSPTGLKTLEDATGDEECAGQEGRATKTRDDAARSSRVIRMDTWRGKKQPGNKS